MSGPNEPYPFWTRRQFFWRVIAPTILAFMVLMAIWCLEMALG